MTPLPPAPELEQLARRTVWFNEPAATIGK